MKPGNNSSEGDEPGVSEVLGTILSLAITVLLFSVVAVGMLGAGDTDNVGMAYVQGEVYTVSDKVILNHIGGDSLLTENLNLRLFINDSLALEPNFTLLTHGYTIDNDGAWEFGDRLIVDQNISKGSTLEVIIIDNRYNNIIAEVDLIFREEQSAPTTGSPTTATTTITTTTVNTTATPVPFPIFPILDCVRDNGDGTYTAYYGYMNPNDWTINIPIGADNMFTPVPQDRGQPTAFECGRHYAVFTVVFDGSLIEWYLDGSTAPASNDPGVMCPELELSSVCDNLWRVDNTAPYEVTFDWEIVGSSENGTHTIPRFYGTLIGEECTWRTMPTMKLEFWTTNCLDNGGSMTMRIYVDGILHDQESSNCEECFPHCYDFYTYSVRAYGVNNSTVEFKMFTFAAANPEIESLKMSWTFSVGGWACTLDHITVERPGIDCENDISFPYCHYINVSDYGCTAPAKKELTFIMRDFTDENGYLMDMRGAQIAFVMDVKCQGDTFYEYFIIDVPI